MAYLSCVARVPSSCQVTLIVLGLNPDVEHVAIGAAGSPSVFVVRSVRVGLVGRSVLDQIQFSLPCYVSI